MAQKTYGIDFGTDTIKIYKKGQGIILLEKKCSVYRWKRKTSCCDR